MAATKLYGTGRRKESVARVYLNQPAAETATEAIKRRPDVAEVTSRPSLNR